MILVSDSTLEPTQPVAKDLVKELAEAVWSIAIERSDVYLAKKAMDTVLGLVGGGYYGCYYDSRSKCSDGSEGCIVGQAMRRIEWPWSEDFGYQGSIGLVLVGRGLDRKSWNALWVKGMQFYQDGGMPWGKCVNEATEYANKMYAEERS